MFHYPFIQGRMANVHATLLHDVFAEDEPSHQTARTIKYLQQKPRKGERLSPQN